MSVVPQREFEAKPAVREQVPALVGLMGPSGGGKTFSALRIATGIQRVRGGEIIVVDTEARRALHYADRFKFQHVEFKEPFGSLDYLAVLRYAEKSCRGGVVVVDSMSHEHEGIGGYLLTHEAELDRIAGSDYEKRDKNKFTAWIKPAAQRRTLINGLLQMNAAFVFCFRAKEKIKPVTGGKPIDLGFMPIAGEEFLFEMTVAALLMPHADGVPTWKSDKVGENLMMKLPEQFRDLFAKRGQITEEHGVAIAEWAKGSSPPAVLDMALEEQRKKTVDAMRAVSRNVAEADVIASEATGGRVQKSAVVKQVGTLDIETLKKIETHCRILADE